MLTLALLLAAPSVTAGGFNLEKVKLSWTKSPIASFYLVEIKSDYYQLKVRKKVILNEVELKLPYGAYRFRVAVINKFGTVSAYSKWQSLVVKKPENVVIRSVTPAIVSKGKAEIAVVISGSNLEQARTIKLRRQNETYELATISRGEDNITVQLQPEGLETGFYDLEIENFKEKTTLRSAALNIVKTQEQVRSEGGRNYILSVNAGLGFWFASDVAATESLPAGTGLTLVFDSISFFKVSPALSVHYMRAWQGGQASSLFSNSVLATYRLSLRRSLGFFLGAGFAIQNIKINGLSFQETALAGEALVMYYFFPTLAVYLGPDFHYLVGNSASKSMLSLKSGISYRW